ncbi:MAG: TonB-dependent receptor plug domain-containing protein [Bacteroidetes bacterium]|nr:TonB-dependent receptor plug domain-containing protein [Bacteroidota bacterium]
MKYLIFSILFGFSASGFSQTAGISVSEADSAGWKSAREDQLESIEVSATRDGLLRKAYSASMPYLSTPSETQAEPLSVVLARIPGLEVRDYGGNGGLKTVTARGTSASQNLVVLDGMIVNDVLTGSANLSLLSLDHLSQVAVQTGGFSSDVANGGLGSTVYLNSRQIGVTRTQIQSSAGSFGTRSWKGMQEFRTGAISGLFHFGSDWTEGNYPLTTGKTRINQDFTGKSGFGSLNAKIGPTESALNLIWNRQEQGVPGPVFQDNSNFSDSRLSNEDIRLIPTLSLFTGSGLIRTSALIRNQRLEYTDASFPTGKSDFHESEFAFRADFLTQHQNTQWNTGIYFRRNLAEADIWRGKPETDKLQRNTLAVFSTKSFSLPVHDLNIQVSGRFEGGKNLPATGSGSVSLSGKTGIVVSSLSISRNIRYPSLNEIRLKSSESSFLVPEKFAGIDGDFMIPFPAGFIRMKGFFYRIQDKIISIPKNLVVWSAINADEVQGTGVEQSSEWAVGKFAFSQFVTLQSVQTRKGISLQAEGKQVVYTPKITAGTSAGWKAEIWQVTTNWRYTGLRNASVENLKSDQLPGFLLGSFSVTGKKTFSLFTGTVDFTLNNLTNQTYEWVMSYPMPGRSFLLTFTLETNP